MVSPLVIIRNVVCIMGMEIRRMVAVMMTMLRMMSRTTDLCKPDNSCSLL